MRIEIHKNLSKKGLTRRTLAVQVFGFGLVIMLLWLDEWLDVPYLLLGAEPTAFNWRESILESVVVTIIGGQTVAWTYEALGRIRYLEGLFTVCVHCNKIHVRDKWVPMDTYVILHSDAMFSHGICPDCGESMYGDQEWWKKMQQSKQTDASQSGQPVPGTAARDAQESTPGTYAQGDS